MYRYGYFHPGSEHAYDTYAMKNGENEGRIDRY